MNPPTQEHLQALEAAIHSARLERHRQTAKWGIQAHDLPTYLAILSEEVGELAQEILNDKFDKRTPNLEVEAVQVAAVALAIVQRIRTGAS